MSKFLYGMFLMFAAQINPDIKDTDHYKEVHGVLEYMEMTQQELEQIGFYIYEDMVNYPVFDDDSRKTFQILDGSFHTNIELYKESDRKFDYKRSKNYYPVAVVDQNYKLLFSSSEAEKEKLLPILVPAYTKTGYKYFLYFFKYTKDLEKDLPDRLEADAYLRKLNDIHQIKK